MLGTKLKCPSSGIPKHRNCPPNQHHDCHNDKGCGYRKTCCLVGCTKRCIDPSKPFTFLVTTKSIASTGEIIVIMIKSLNIFYIVLAMGNFVPLSPIKFELPSSSKALKENLNVFGQ